MATEMDIAPMAVLTGRTCKTSVTLHPSKIGYVQKKRSSTEYGSSVEGSPFYILVLEAEGVKIFLKFHEDHTKKFHMEPLEHAVSIQLSAKRFSEAAEYIETELQAEWSVSQSLDRVTFKGQLIFSFSSKASAALFKLRFE